MLGYLFFVQRTLKIRSEENVAKAYKHLHYIPLAEANGNIFLHEYFALMQVMNRAWREEHKK